MEKEMTIQYIIAELATPVILIAAGYLIGYLVEKIKEPSTYIHDLYLKRLELYQSFYNRIFEVKEMFLKDSRTRKDYNVIRDTLQEISIELEMNCLYFDHRAFNAIAGSINQFSHAMLEFYPLNLPEELNLKQLDEESKRDLFHSILGQPELLKSVLMNSLKMLHVPFRRTGIYKKIAWEKRLEKIFPGRNKTWLDIISNSKIVDNHIDVEQIESRGSNEAATER